VHVCFAVTGWPPGGSPDLLSQFARVPGTASVSTAVVLGAIRRAGRDQGPVGARTLVRVTAAPRTAGACLREVQTVARKLGVRLVRLDGEHAAAVYATTPTAAPYGWRTW
jgi:hypothetical protein